MDSRVLSVASDVAASKCGAVVFPLPHAGPAEVERFVRAAAGGTAQSQVARLERNAPGAAPGTLLVAAHLTDVVLRDPLLDGRPRCVVDTRQSHMANQEVLPDGLAVSIGTRKSVLAAAYFVQTVCFHRRRT